MQASESFQGTDREEFVPILALRKHMEAATVLHSRDYGRLHVLSVDTKWLVVPHKRLRVSSKQDQEYLPCYDTL